MICITGKSGSGKTTAIKYLKKQGFQTFVADNYIKQIYQRNQIGFNLIVEHFGKQYTHFNKVNKKKLGILVFNDLNAMNKLQNIIWPLIYDKLLEIKNPHLIVELAIYLKNPNFFANLFTHIVIITRNEDLRHKSTAKKFNYLQKKQFSPITNEISQKCVKIPNNRDKKAFFKQLSVQINAIFNS